jgi:uncharacterized protein with von Willebrand factor type A (vWA) domain
MTQATLPTSVPLPGVSGTAASSTSARFTPVDPIRLLRQYRVVLIVTVLIGAGLGVGLHFVLAHFMPQYTAVAKVRVKREVTDPYVAAAGYAFGNRDAVEIIKQTQAAYIRSDRNLRAALKRADVKATEWYAQFDGDFEEAFRQFNRIITVEPVRTAELIDVQVTCPHAEDSAILANVLVNEYLQWTRDQSSSSRTNIEELFNRQRRVFQEEIEALETDLQNIMDETRYTIERQTLDEIEAQFEQLIVRRDETIQQLSAAQRSYQQLAEAIERQAVEFEAEDLMIVENDPIIRNVDARILALRQQRRVALER